MREDRAKCYQKLKKVKFTLEKEKKRTEIQEKIPVCHGHMSGRKTYFACWISPYDHEDLVKYLGADSC